MTVPVLWWSHSLDIQPANQWDSGMLHWLFANELGPTDFDFEDRIVHTEIHSFIAGPSHAVVVIAARHEVDYVADINRWLAHFDGVVLILMGDEEGAFPWKEIQHPNIRFWVMMPHPAKHADMEPWAYFFGTGMKADTREILSGFQGPKVVPWAFAGQATHARRQQAVNGLHQAATRVAGVLEPTAGFTQGRERHAYLELLSETKITPSPSGPCSPDSMRLYEALQAGCVPIVDTGPDGYGIGGFWEMAYGNDHPLIVLNDWTRVTSVIEAELTRWPHNANRASSWWMRQKRGMARRMSQDLRQIGAKPDHERKLTVIITASPIPSDPDPAMLLHTLMSVELNLPDAEVIIAFDGVRPEQADMRAAYGDHVANICRTAQNQWHNVLPLVSDHHAHQANMVRWALDHVDTPTVLLLEHDTPLSLEEADSIDWEACADMVAYGAVDVLRFHHEASIHPEHEHLMLDHETRTILGVPLRRTSQWSQRPHLANTAYYRRILDNHFPVQGSAFIEDRMHGLAQGNPDRHRIAIYHPEGSIRRSLHIDGRAGGPKFSELQVF